MRNILYILKRDTKRILSNPVAVIVLIGICVLPSFYAWINIVAYMDPYSNLSDIKVAVSVMDEGATQELTGEINIGSQIREELKGNDTLNWQFVSEEDAVSGVKSGKYYAAFVIPQDFSSDFVSLFKGKIKKPQISYYVNEKINTVAPKITDTGAETIQTEINSGFRGAVAEAVMKTLKDTSGKTLTEIHSKDESLKGLMDRARGVISDYEGVISGIGRSKKYRNDIIADSRSLANESGRSLSAAHGIITTDKKVISTALDDTHAAEERIREFHREHPDVLPELTEDVLNSISKVEDSLDSADMTLSEAEGLTYALKPSVMQMSDMLDNLKTGMKYADDSMDSMGEALDSTNKVLADAQKSISVLESSDNLKQLEKILNTDDASFAEVVSSPVKLKTENLYSVKNYGSGMAPFFTMLAIWVGGLMLIALFRLEVDTDLETERRITMRQGYLGRGLLFTIIGILQTLIVCTGDLVLGIQCVHPVAFVLSGLVSSVVFVNLIYALAVAFRHIGKAIAVILVILQIPGSSGTFPIELTGSFFRRIYPLLPFSYGIDASREAIAGFFNNTYWWALAMLLVFLIISLFIGLVMRPQLAAINHTFDTRLADTGIFLSETGLKEKENIAIKKAIRLINSRKESKEELERKVNSFERIYSRILSQGFAGTIILLAVPLILLFILPAKPVLMCIWVICIILLVIILFYTEHIHLAITERKYSEGGESR